MRIFLAVFALLVAALFASESSYKLTGYKTNYLLPYAYDFVRKDGRKEYEAKFRLSFKRPITHEFLGFDASFYLAYSQLSLWQVWDREDSSPFRETNYNPEFFVHIPYTKGDIFRWWRVGYEHESNGQNLPLSRSWDRIYGAVACQYGDFRAIYKFWSRISESGKIDDDDPAGDDNPDIHKYYGFSELKINYTKGEHEVALMARKGVYHGAFEVSYNKKIAGNLYAYLQYFNGFGESLIDYNRRVEKLGFGVMFERGE